MGHIYDTEPIIDKRITKTGLAKFDQVWLGGDLTSNTGFDWKLEYIDSVFDVKSENTHWTLGNHDVVEGDDFILNYTKKPPFYATYINGITLLNFNSIYYDQVYCESIDAQTAFIKMVCDTIEESSHLVLMTHHVPYGGIEDIDAWSFANTSIETRTFRCDTFGVFKDVIYPELVEVQNKNIQVIHLAGDMGQKQSTFEHKTKEGVQFLGSGVLSSNEYNLKFKKVNSNDSVLVFEHTPSLNKLEWAFIDVGNK
jgi:hypothetical protein